MKQPELFDTWEEDNKKLIEYYHGMWVESNWNKNVWYYELKNGYSAYDKYERTMYEGTMLPIKYNICH